MITLIWNYKTQFQLFGMNFWKVSPGKDSIVEWAGAGRKDDEGLFQLQWLIWDLDVCVQRVKIF